jgi:hypothetical protein
MNPKKRIVLQNEGIFIRFNELGAITQLVDKRIGRNYVAALPHYGRPLFRLFLSEMEDGHILPGQLELDSSLSESCEMNLDEENGTVVWRFTKIDGLPIDVECKVRIDRHLPFSYWTIEINNETALAIREIEYPIMHVTYQLGDSPHDDRILIPKHDGHLVGNPDYYPWEGDGISRDNMRYMYPGEGRSTPSGMSAQMIAYYDHVGGLYMATYDDQGHTKKLGPSVVRTDGSAYYDFSPAHIFSEVPGLSVKTTYETVVGFFEGDWQSAADIYKQWAVQAPWCEKTIAEREDIPDWVKKGAFFFNFRLRHQEDGEQFLERVPDYLDKWQKTLNIPLVAMMCGWENIGEWTGPEYFPPFGGDDRFRRMFDRMKKVGIRPFPFGLSGLKLAIRKKIPKSISQPELAVDYDARKLYEKSYRTHVATNQDGEVILESKINSWDGLHAYACPTTEQARDQLYGASMKLIQDYGAQISQADQLFNGATTECYNVQHAHPLGRGTWQIDAIRGIYQDIRRDGKKADADFVLSQEWQSELYLQELDIYHCRNYDQPRGIMGVPLFAYLYHEYLPSYGGDWNSFLSDNTNGVYAHAANYVNGNMPAGCPQSMFKMTRNVEPEEANEAILSMAIHTSSLHSRFPEFLIMGKMLNTQPLQVEGERITFVGVIFGFAKGDLTVPSVLHQAWQAPDGRIAYALANVTSRKQEVYLNVQPYTTLGKVDLILNINQDQRHVIASDIELPYTIDIVLNEGDAALLEIVQSPKDE